MVAKRPASWTESSHIPDKPVDLEARQKADEIVSDLHVYAKRFSDGDLLEIQLALQAEQNERKERARFAGK